MKVAVIGASGHFYGAREEIVKRAFEVCLAPGDASEDIAPARRAFQGALVYAGWREMLDRERPDLAVVNSFFSHNARIAAEVLDRGVHCYCEKPAATCLEDLRLVMDAAGRGRARYASMLEMRQAPAFIAAQRAVAGGAIGEALLVSAQKSYKLGIRHPFYKKKQTYGGTILWIGVHIVDFIRWITGQDLSPVAARQSAKGNRGNGEMEMTSSCLFDLSLGGSAVMTLDYARPASAATHGDDRIRIAGEKGVIEVRSEKCALIDDRGERALPLPETQDLFLSFLNSIEGKGACIADAADAFEAAKICLLAQKMADDSEKLQ